ncbi:MAG: hypothetical protein IKP58_00595 [Victivallales bacterium]|nr:hypothetical protein [Victivallales bacterium]
MPETVQHQATAIFTMKGYICDKLLKTDSMDLAVRDLPDLEHPLLDGECYRKWGAMRKWGLETLRLIREKRLDKAEVEEFDAYNTDCIDAFKFVVWLMNSNPALPCSKCRLLSERMRLVFGNDFYLMRFEDDSTLSLESPVGYEDIYMYPAVRYLRLKRYHDLTSGGEPGRTMHHERRGSLSLFMPCVWELASRSDVPSAHGDLKRLLDELENLEVDKDVDYDVICGKAMALYKARLKLFSFYEKSNVHCIHDCCALAMRLWTRPGGELSSVVTPALSVFPDYKNHYARFDEELAIDISIAKFFIRLLLWEDGEQSFGEIGALAEWFGSHPPKCGADGTLMIYGMTAVETPQARFTVTFDESISDERRDGIIRLFLRDVGNDIDDAAFTECLGSCEVFSCWYYLGGDARMNILFMRGGANHDVGGVGCRIIRGDDLYGWLKGQRPATPEILRSAVRGNPYLLAVFDESSPDTRKRIRYVRQALTLMPEARELVLLLVRKKLCLANTLKVWIRTRKGASLPATSGRTSRTMLGPVYFACLKLVAGRKLDYNDMEIKFRFGLDKTVFAGDVGRLSLVAKEVLGVKESPDLPAHYLRPAKYRQSALKSWFLGFTEKHRDHNLCVLTVVMALLFAFFSQQKVVDEGQVRALIKKLKKSYWKQKEKKWEKNTQGGVQYRDMLEFFTKKLDAVLGELLRTP